MEYILQELELIVREYSRVFFIIDGLDEWYVSPGDRQILLRRILDLPVGIRNTIWELSIPASRVHLLTKRGDDNDDRSYYLIPAGLQR